MKRSVETSVKVNIHHAEESCVDPIATSDQVHKQVRTAKFMLAGNQL